MGDKVWLDPMETEEQGKRKGLSTAGGCLSTFLPYADPQLHLVFNYYIYFYLFIYLYCAEAQTQGSGMLAKHPTN
jgi:hypothetical protein